jgi:hypothetical protein
MSIEASHDYELPATFSYIRIHRVALVSVRSVRLLRAFSVTFSKRVPKGFGVHMMFDCFQPRVLKFFSVRPGSVRRLAFRGHLCYTPRNADNHSWHRCLPHFFRAAPPLLHLLPIHRQSNCQPLRRNISPALDSAARSDFLAAHSPPVVYQLRLERGVHSTIHHTQKVFVHLSGRRPPLHRSMDASFYYLIEV